MSKRLLSAALMVLSLVVSPLMSLNAQALSPLSNALIKLEGSPTVYWLATDNKRYVFPNPRTFYSWFTESDLARVLTFSPQELGRIALGGNVTYRPGARLIKVTTDPRVYAVGRYGTLRWITSEALAQQLYGQNWAQQVDDVPDEFFTNYQVGAAVYTASQFDVQFELGQARSPSENIRTGGVVYPPQNPPLSGFVNFSVANTIVGLGDTVVLSGNALNVGELAQNMTISLINKTTGQTLRSCTGTLPCTYNLYVDQTVINAGSSQNFYARVTSINGGALNSSDSNVQFRGSNSSASVSIGANTTRPTYGQIVTVTANLNGNIDARTGTLAILGPNGTVVQNCPSQSVCTFTFGMDSGNGNAYYMYTGRFTPASTGIPVNTSPVYIYVPGANNNTIATAHTITFSQSAVRPGENFTVTARLTPDSTSSPFYTIRIYDQWDVLQHTCVNVRTCVLQQTLSPTTDTSRTYYASATADTGHSIGSGNATIQVTPSSQVNNARRGSTIITGTVTSDAAVSNNPFVTVNSGSSVRITLALEPFPTNVLGLKIKILSQDGATVLDMCENSVTCTISRVMTNTGSQDITTDFKLRLEDAYGDWYQTHTPNIIVRPVQTQDNSNSMFNRFFDLSPSNTTVSHGDTLTLNARVSPQTGSANGFAITITNPLGTVLKTCNNAFTCSVEQPIYNTGSQDASIVYSARVTSLDGHWNAANTPTITILGTPVSNNITGSIGLGISHATISSSQTFNLNARVLNSNVSDSNLKIAWYQSSNDALMTFCVGINPCLISTSYPTIGGQSRVLSFYAKAWDTTNGRSSELRSEPISVTITP